MTIQQKQQFDEILNVEYQRGLKNGLQVAETIVTWLSKEPDNPWQENLRKWAQRAIQRAHENNPS